MHDITFGFVSMGVRLGFGTFFYFCTGIPYRQLSYEKKKRKSIGLSMLLLLVCCIFFHCVGCCTWDRIHLGIVVVSSLFVTLL